MSIHDYSIVCKDPNYRFRCNIIADLDIIKEIQLISGECISHQTLIKKLGFDIEKDKPPYHIYYSPSDAYSYCDYLIFGDGYRLYANINDHPTIIRGNNFTFLNKKGLAHREDGPAAFSETLNHYYILEGYFHTFDAWCHNLKLTEEEIVYYRLKYETNFDYDQYFSDTLVKVDYKKYRR